MKLTILMLLILVNCSELTEFIDIDAKLTIYKIKKSELKNNKCIFFLSNNDYEYYFYVSCNLYEIGDSGKISFIKEGK